MKQHPADDRDAVILDAVAVDMVMPHDQGRVSTGGGFFKIPDADNRPHINGKETRHGGIVISAIHQHHITGVDHLVGGGIPALRQFELVRIPDAKLIKQRPGEKPRLEWPPLVAAVFEKGDSHRIIGNRHRVFMPDAGQLARVKVQQLFQPVANALRQGAG